MTRGDVHYLTKMNIPSKWKPHFYSQSNCKIVVTFPNRYIPHYIRLRVKFNKQLVERNGGRHHDYGYYGYYGYHGYYGYYGYYLPHYI